MQDVKITGVQETIKAFGAASVEDARRIDEGLLACAHVVLRKALKYVPKDTHALEKTGQVQVEGRGFGARASVVFGGEDAPYALWVHEILDHYHEPPTCAKFLERAARETRGTQTSILRRKIVGRTDAIVDGEVEPFE